MLEVEMDVNKLNIILGTISEIIVVIDDNGIVQYESETMDSIFGYPVKDIIGTSILERTHPDDREMLVREIANCSEKKDEKIVSEYRLKHKNDGWRTVELTARNMNDNPHIKGLLLNIRDVTPFVKAKKRAFYYEFHDSLTGLPNKEMFISRLSREMERSKKDHIFAVMCIGMNKFKNINNLYGFSAGDEILLKIGTKLKNIFRNDDLVSRFDGDRFLILLSDIRCTDNINSIFQKTLEAFSEPIVINSNIIKITASMGLCFYPHDGNDVNLLIENSEAAMCLAKEPGRNNYKLFDTKLNQKMLHRLKLESELQDGLLFNEFEVYYQPKVDQFGSIAGMESLIRWQSRSRGMVYPDEFIPIMENNGMISDLDRFVLYTSCVQNRKWQESGFPPLPVAVNISPSEFRHKGLISEVKNALTLSGLDPKYLELEITETAIMENEEKCLETITAIHDLGVSISIDDFGTGYSSLSKLKDYPIDVLKIDKSFIDDFPENNRSAILTNSIIGLAHSLGFKVITEGVEQRAQLDLLIELGSDFFQGYYFNKPVCASEMGSLLKKDFLCA